MLTQAWRKEQPWPKSPADRESIAVSEEAKSKVQEAVDQVMELDEEVEAPGHARLDAQALDSMRATLHAWVDTVKGVVVNPALGRVVLIHEDGRRSSVASADLPFALSQPVSGKLDSGE
jgi:hypothetical protein